MLDEIVAKFSDAHFMAILFAAVGSAATVLTAAMPWLQPDTLSRRIKAVSSERERIRARERERLQASQSKTTLRVRPSGLAKQLVETLNLSSWLSTEKAKIQLAMAGFRGIGAEYTFLTFRLATPIAFFIAAIVYQFLIIKWSQPAMVKIGIAIAATYLGIKAPELFLKNKRAKRQKELERAFPNTLDLLLICAELGMSIEHGVRKVSRGDWRRERLDGGGDGDFGRGNVLSGRAADRIRESRLKNRAGFRSFAHNGPLAVGALWHAAGDRAPGSQPRKPRPSHVARREKGGCFAAGSHGANDPLLSARALRCDSDASHHSDQQLELGAPRLSRPRS